MSLDPKKLRIWLTILNGPQISGGNPATFSTLTSVLHRISTTSIRGISDYHINRLATDVLRCTISVLNTRKYKKSTKFRISLGFAQVVKQLLAQDNHEMIDLHIRNDLLVTNYLLQGMIVYSQPPINPSHQTQLFTTLDRQLNLHIDLHGPLTIPLQLHSALITQWPTYTATLSIDDQSSNTLSSKLTDIRL